jgi:hypothetical protein
MHVGASGLTPPSPPATPVVAPAPPLPLTPVMLLPPGPPSSPSVRGSRRSPPHALPMNAANSASDNTRLDDDPAGAEGPGKSKAGQLTEGDFLDPSGDELAVWSPA